MPQILPDAAAEDQGLQQRVAGQAIRAVDTGTGHLAAGPQTRHGGSATVIGPHAAHVEMRRRRHRQQARTGIDAVFFT